MSITFDNTSDGLSNHWESQKKVINGKISTVSIPKCNRAFGTAGIHVPYVCSVLQLEKLIEMPSPSPSPSGGGAGPDTNNYTGSDNFLPGDYVINRWHHHLPMWTESDTLRVIRAHAGEHLARAAAAAVAGWKAEAEAAAAEAHSK